MRSERWLSWSIGLVFGFGAGAMTLTGVLWFTAIALLAFAFVAARSYAFLSGAFAGFGLGWLALLAWTAQATPSMVAFLAFGFALILVGSVIGIAAWRRRAAQLA